MYKKRDVAEYFGVSVGAVDKWMYSGKIEYIKIQRSVRFTQQHIENFIKKNQMVAN